MKRVTLLLLFSLFFISSCSLANRDVCEAPNVKIGNNCCLDENTNDVCDNEEVELSCPETCDDEDVCTEDVCGEDTGYECRHNAIRPCCGDTLCDVNETYVTCPSDCVRLVDETTLQEEIVQMSHKNNSVFTRTEEEGKIVYSNKLIGAKITDLPLGFYDQEVLNKVTDYYDIKATTGKKDNELAQLFYKNTFNYTIDYYNLSGVTITFATVTLKTYISKEVYYTGDFLDYVSRDVYFFFPCTNNLMIELEKDPKSPGLGTINLFDEVEVDQKLDEYAERQKTFREDTIKEIIAFCKG